MPDKETTTKFEIAMGWVWQITIPEIATNIENYIEQLQEEKDAKFNEARTSDGADITGC